MKTNNLLLQDLRDNYSNTALNIRRGTGLIIDGLILWFPFAFLAGYVSFILADYIRVSNLTLVSEIVLILLAMALILNPSFLYFYLLEKNYQQTIGKMIKNLKVTNREGGKPTKNEIFYRTLARCIPIDPFSYIFIKNGYHNRISKTVVIKNKI